MFKKITISIVAATTISTNLLADNSTQLGTVFVTSTSFKSSQKDAPFSTEIYTQNEIKESNSKDLYEFLNNYTSVVTMPSYGNPFIQKIDLRGYGMGDGYQNIVITVDGRKLNNVDMTPQLLSSISLDNIEKIEIIKGSGSVEFGDGANAGVINITTKGKNRNFIKAYGGNYGVKYGILSLGYSGDKFAISGMMDYYGSDGNRKIDSDNYDKKYSKNKKVSILFFPTDDIELRATRAFSNLDTKYANHLTLDIFNQDPTQIGVANWQGVAYSQQYLSSNLTSFGVSYSIYNDLELVVDYSDEGKISRYPSWESTYDYKNIKSKLKLKKDNFSSVFGVDKFDGDRINESQITTKNNLGYFFSSKINILAATTLLIGYRKERVKYEYKPDSGSSLSDDSSLNAYDIGLNYKLNGASSIFVNYNSSFQAPDIDRFFQNGSFNSFIEPATVKTLNIGYSNFTKINRFKATLFKSKLKNEIYYYNSGNWATSYNTNIDKSYKYGFELFDKFTINSNLFTSINYSYIVAKIDEEDEANGAYNGKDLPGVSKHNLTATLGYKYANSSLLLAHKYRSSAYAINDFENSFAQKQKAYHSTNLSLKRTIKKRFELFATVQNFFNQKNGIWIEDDIIYPTNFTRTYNLGLKVTY